MKTEHPRLSGRFQPSAGPHPALRKTIGGRAHQTGCGRQRRRAGRSNRIEMHRSGPRDAPERSSDRFQFDIQVRRGYARDANPPVEFVPDCAAVLLAIDVYGRAALTDPYHQGNAVLLGVGALHHAFDGHQTVLDLPRTECRRRNPLRQRQRTGAMRHEARVQNDRRDFCVADDPCNGDPLTRRIPPAAGADTHAHPARGVLYEQQTVRRIGVSHHPFDACCRGAAGRGSLPGNCRCRDCNAALGPEIPQDTRYQQDGPDGGRIQVTPGGWSYSWHAFERVSIVLSAARLRHFNRAPPGP